MNELFHVPVHLTIVREICLHKSERPYVASLKHAAPRLLPQGPSSESTALLHLLFVFPAPELADASGRAAAAHAHDVCFSLCAAAVARAQRS